MSERIDVAREALLEAGSLVREAFGRPAPVTAREKDLNDYVTEVDLESERIITSILTGAFPDTGIMGEESTRNRGGETMWIIDPLDGTTNFIHRYPHVGISIALREKEELVLGLTYDPLRDEMFEASLGGGARLNGRPISVSSAGSLDDSLLATGFPFRAHQHLEAYMSVFKDLFLECRGVRRAGAAVLDLAHVAAGRLDGFWELYLKPWDMAAGILLVREAGGEVTDFFGGDSSLRSGNIVAAPPALIGPIVRAASTHFRPEDIIDLGCE
jgi:myo-inositol-1(or 4)-monophosphatase